MGKLELVIESDNVSIYSPKFDGVVDKLRSIEHQIYIETRRAHSDYEDYQKVKKIIETITI